MLRYFLLIFLYCVNAFAAYEAETPLQQKTTWSTGSEHYHLTELPAPVFDLPGEEEDAFRKRVPVPEYYSAFLNNKVNSSSFFSVPSPSKGSSDLHRNCPLIYSLRVLRL